MELFTDFEQFLFLNDFVEELGNATISTQGLPRIFVKRRDSTSKRPMLSDVETFILENDFHENSDYVHHSHLIENPLYVQSSNEQVNMEGPRQKRPRLSSMESFLIKNDFTESCDNMDYAHLTRNPIFSTSLDSPSSPLTCTICKDVSTTSVDYLMHMSRCRRTQHQRPSPRRFNRIISCKFCPFKTKKRVKLEYHEAQNHRCTKCNFTSGGGLRAHMQSHQSGGSAPQQPTPDVNLTQNPFKEVRAFKGYVRTYRESELENEDSLVAYLERSRSNVSQLIIRSLRDLKVCKAQFSVFVTFRRYLCKGVDGKKIYEVINKPMNSRMLALMNSFTFNDVYDKWCQKILENVDIFQKYGSGWVFSRVTGADLRVGKLLPQRGGCGARVPVKLQKKKAILNVLSRDNQCFKWAVLASLHRADLTQSQKRQPGRSYYYKKFEDNYDWSDMEFPVDVSTIPKFEDKSELAINVFSYDWEDGVLPVYISKNVYTGMKIVNLLLLESGDSFHFATITDINRLLGKDGCHRRLLCYNCLNTFLPCKPMCSSTCDKTCKLTNHIENCLKFKYQRMKMPTVDSDSTDPV